MDDFLKGLWYSSLMEEPFEKRDDTKAFVKGVRFATSYLIEALKS